MLNNVTNYDDHDCQLQGYVAYPKQTAQKLPVMLIAPDWRGHSEFVRSKADYMASLGYIGFAIDIYGGAKSGKSRDENAKLMQPFIADRLLLQRRLLAAFNHAKKLTSADPQRIAIMGYCFGGLCALDLMRSGADIIAAISFHGILLPAEPIKTQTSTAKVLVLHGQQDPMVSSEQLAHFIQEMSTAKLDWQLHIHGRAMHAFTNPLADDADFGTVYDQLTTQRTERVLKNFLEEIF